MDPTVKGCMMFGWFKKKSTFEEPVDAGKEEFLRQVAKAEGPP
jgi:hypothetical protein